MAKEDLYAVLGVARDANEGDISKAYKGLARSHHPDKGGDVEKFKQIQQAYEVLGEQKSREYYDMTGSIPGEGGGGGGGFNPFGGGGGFPGGMPFGVNMNDLFGMFGGGGRGGGPKRRRQGKAPPRVERLPVSLSQLYNGGSFTICLNRDKFCPTCKGDGSKVLKTCGKCGGSGTTIQHVQVGPGMVMQTQGPCGDCQGKGEQKGDPCSDCSGQGLTRQTKNIDIIIKPGSSAGDVLVFDSEASDTLDFEKGSDLQIVLESAEDPNSWVRDGNNLRNEIHISLKEALCGTHVTLYGHPGFGTVSIEVPKGTMNGTEINVVGRGMPKVGGNGNLYLKVHVLVQEVEARVLLEKAEALAGVFSYTHVVPVGDNVWTSMKAI